MIRPDLLGSLVERSVSRVPTVVSRGRVTRVSGAIIEAHAPDARIGTLVEIRGPGAAVTGEVVAFQGELALIAPLGDVRGISPGALVEESKKKDGIAVSTAMLGRVVDPYGQPIDGRGPLRAQGLVPLERGAPPLGERARVATPFETGIRALDVLLTAGKGQRLGFFAGAGVGKTVLIRQIAAQSKADVVVIGLIGERGGEVRDLLETQLGPHVVCVVATSDKSALERARGAQAATAVAEHFRDQGKDVLLVIDSLTRYAMALREIGLAAGEPPATKGYPPSVFAALPRLLERAGPLTRGGSITGFYTVLMEGDDLNDPVADSARSLLDGHVVLSRELAQRGHFPAIDVLPSTSRVARAVSPPELVKLAERARALLAAKKEVDELRSLGAYVPGASASHDEGAELGQRVLDWSKQPPGERSSAAEARASLEQLLAKPVTRRKA
jgi:flagellum-specific ATP synthase